MKVHYLQHVFYEDLGYIGEWLKIGGHEVSVTKFHQSGFKFPDQQAFDVLIVLGGPMSVGEEELYPWLTEEKNFIRRSIESGKVVLGICLGAQLIASCLAAKVTAAPYREIGWFPVMPNHKCKSSAWFHELFTHCPIVFHWHGDRFEIPIGGGCNLLSSAANNNQAFAYGKKVLALQFHLEATVESVRLMIENGQSDMVKDKYVQSVEQLSDGLVHVETNHLLMDRILTYLFTQLD